jgi:AIPR protein
MEGGMTPEQLVQLKQVLEDRFFPFMPKRTDPSARGWSEEQHQLDRFSRSYAAFCVAKMAGLSESDACNTVIDGRDDNGIDAIFPCSTQGENRLILVQSKFKENAAPDLEDTLKFLQGVRDLAARRYNRFNQAFNLKLSSIQPTLDLADLKVDLVMAHLSGDLPSHSKNNVDNLLDELNAAHEVARFVNFDGNEGYRHLTEEYAPAPINDVIEMHNWVIVNSAPRVMYGQVSVHTLSQLYVRHQRGVFGRNIRNYIGEGTVNDAIAQTIREEPSSFMHLNNGLTIVCNRFTPRGMAQQQRAMFDLNELSIVNGAQTVGSIARVSQDLDLTDSRAKVLVTVLESVGAGSGFEQRVTQTRNTQNQIRISDFAAQDATQERLRRELAVSGVTYHYKPGEQSPPADSSNITLAEAVTALACFSGKLEDIVTVRSSLPQASNPSSAIYKRLFKDSLTGGRLYRKVAIFRLMGQFAEGSIWAAGPNSAEREFYRNMRLFVMHFVKRQHSSLFDHAELVLTTDEEQTLSRAFNEIGENILEVGNAFLRETQPGRGYLWLSGNLTAITQLASRLSNQSGGNDDDDNKDDDETVS